jgi:hypothetical protein
VPFVGFDFTRPEVDLHLDDHGGSASSLRRPGAPTLEIEGSLEFGHWVVSLNSGEHLLWVAPAGERSLTLAIRAV